MLDIDCAAPNIAPCSLAEVLFEIKLGIVVFMIPMPDAIKVIETIYAAIVGSKGIRIIPSIIIRDPYAIRLASPNL